MVEIKSQYYSNGKPMNAGSGDDLPDVVSCESHPVLFVPKGWKGVALSEGAESKKISLNSSTSLGLQGISFVKLERNQDLWLGRVHRKDQPHVEVSITPKDPRYTAMSTLLSIAVSFVLLLCFLSLGTLRESGDFINSIKINSLSETGVFNLNKDKELSVGIDSASEKWKRFYKHYFNRENLEKFSENVAGLHGWYEHKYRANGAKLILGAQLEKTGMVFSYGDPLAKAHQKQLENLKRRSSGLRYQAFKRQQTSKRFLRKKSIE